MSSMESELRNLRSRVRGFTDWATQAPLELTFYLWLRTSSQQQNTKNSEGYEEIKICVVIDKVWGHRSGGTSLDGMVRAGLSGDMAFEQRPE